MANGEFFASARGHRIPDIADTRQKHALPAESGRSETCVRGGRQLTMADLAPIRPKGGGRGKRSNTRQVRQGRNSIQVARTLPGLLSGSVNRNLPTGGYPDAFPIPLAVGDGGEVLESPPATDFSEVAERRLTHSIAAHSR